MRKNIIANIIGKFWSILSNFLFVPLYIHLLGLESYSIISFTLVLNGLLAVMDAGLTATLSREFASSKNTIAEKIKIFKTLETCYLMISLVVILLLFLSSNAISTRWLNLNAVDPSLVSHCLKIIAFDIGLRLLGHFYSGAYNGLEKQVKSNLIQVIYGVFRNGLVLIPIYYFPSLYFFFIWQCVVTVIYVLVLRLDLSLMLEQHISTFFRISKIDSAIIRKVWKFAGGMMLISLVAGLNSQMDKIALSKLLSIEILGLYTLAFALSRGLSFISAPVSTAILPRITKLFTSGKENEAIILFDKSYLIVSIIIFSFTASIVLFAREIIEIWTNDPYISSQAYKYVPWIAIGTAFLSLGYLPFNVAIANGDTKYNNILGIASLIITLPGYWLFTYYFGGIGAAITFSFVQVIIVIIFLHLVNSKYLHLSIKLIYLKNFLAPLAISFLITIGLQLVINFDGHRFLNLLKIISAIIIAISVNLLLLVPFRNLTKEYNIIFKRKV